MSLSDELLIGFSVCQALAPVLIGFIPVQKIGHAWLGVSRHDSFTVALGSSYGSFLTLPPGPIPTHLFCLGKFLRRLMKSFAFFSHDRNITHNP